MQFPGSYFKRSLFIWTQKSYLKGLGIHSCLFIPKHPFRSVVALPYWVPRQELSLHCLGPDEPTCPCYNTSPWQMEWPTHPGLPRTAQVLKLKVSCLRNPLNRGRTTIGGHPSGRPLAKSLSSSGAQSRPELAGLPHATHCLHILASLKSIWIWKVYLKLLTEGTPAGDHICQVFLFSPPVVGPFIIFNTIPSEFRAQMITWANAKIVGPLAWLQREREPRYPISPLSWVPWPIKGPKWQKLGCYHNLPYPPAITKSHSWPPQNFYNPAPLPPPLCSFSSRSSLSMITVSEPFWSSFLPISVHSPLGQNSKHTE